jgi:hypothetical protein
MQKSFSDLEFASKRKQTRRERFLEEIGALVPWAALIAAIASFYPKGEGRGRPPVGLERMLRMLRRAALLRSVGRGHRGRPAGHSLGRLWQATLAADPKQFLTVLGGKSLVSGDLSAWVFQQTAVTANAAHRFVEICRH